MNEKQSPRIDRLIDGFEKMFEEAIIPLPTILNSIEHDEREGGHDDDISVILNEGVVVGKPILRDIIREVLKLGILFDLRSLEEELSEEELRPIREERERMDREDLDLSSVFASFKGKDIPS